MKRDRERHGIERGDSVCICVCVFRGWGGCSQVEDEMEGVGG